MSRKRPAQRRQVPRVQAEAGPPEINPELSAAILAIVDRQLREGTPPETRQTLERLVAAGYTPEGARQLIAQVVVNEIFNVMARGETYNEQRFLTALQRLPQHSEAS